MKKIVLSLIAIFILVTNAYAKPARSDFQSVIRDFNIDNNAIAISIKDVNTEKSVYSKNENIAMNPASLLKLITMPAVCDMLGEDYKFTTELYSVKENEYFIKLGADPYLESADLKDLVMPIKIGAENIYIDDTILDTKTWGEGWQWDDDLNVLMPRFGSYNLDKNLIKIIIIPEDDGRLAKIINASKYPLVFYNNITTSNKTSLDIKRDIAISPNTLVLSGTVARQTVVYIPAIDLKKHFEAQLRQALENKKVYMKNSYKFGQKKSGYKLESSVEHNFSYAMDDILKNSNNMAAETVFKLAGGKYRGKCKDKYSDKNGVNCNDAVTGSDISGVEMFNAYCDKIKVDRSAIKITDGSGVSKNNLLTAAFVTDYLIAAKNNPAMKHMAKPGEGTLVQRLLSVKDNLRAKTGTLSGVSSLAGYITTRSGKEYAFCIMQNDVKLSPSDKKLLEDSIIKEIYLKL